MMKKCIKIQLLTVSMVACISAAVLCGCGAENAPISFEEAAVLQEAEDVDGENTEPTDLQAEGEEEQEGETRCIVIYICGAVDHPGVFTLPEGSRVNDALEAAGGFAENAAQSSINLAARLQDEEMIRVLTLEELEAENREEGSDSLLIDINTADVAALCDLPGIGESKARDIILYRKENGAFRIKEDIMKVAGIKENLYKKICDRITVN